MLSSGETKELRLWQRGAEPSVLFGEAKNSIHDEGRKYCIWKKIYEMWNVEERDYRLLREARECLDVEKDIPEKRRRYTSRRVME